MYQIGIVAACMNVHFIYFSYDTVVYASLFDEYF
jgi:hypothetical protein